MPERDPSQPFADSRAGRLLSSHPQAGNPDRYERIAYDNERAAERMGNDKLAAPLLAAARRMRATAAELRAHRAGDRAAGTE